MTKVFIGGSRAITRLHPEVAKRLRNMIDGKLMLLVGDANGADKAVQRFLAEHEPPYERVEVFCSGSKPRNAVLVFTNLAEWEFGEVWQGKGFTHELLSAALCEPPR